MEGGGRGEEGGGESSSCPSTLGSDRRQHTAGFERIVDHDSGTFKYFLKVVPTEYQFLHGMSTGSLPPFPLPRLSPSPCPSFHCYLYTIGTSVWQLNYDMLILLTQARL